jgi:hypothetical protein
LCEVGITAERPPKDSRSGVNRSEARSEAAQSTYLEKADSSICQRCPFYGDALRASIYPK